MIDALAVSAIGHTFTMFLVGMLVISAALAFKSRVWTVIAAALFVAFLF